MHVGPRQRLRLWSLREDVAVTAGPRADQLTVSTPWDKIILDGMGPTESEALRRMSLGPVSLENVLSPQARAILADGEAVPAEAWLERDRLDRLLARLGCCVVHSLGLADGIRPVLSVVPISCRANFQTVEVEAAEPIRLSRFAAVRVGADGDLELEAPAMHHQVVLHRPTAGAVVGALGRPGTVTTVAASLRVPEPLVSDIVAFLAGARMVVTGKPIGARGRAAFAEDTEPGLLGWSNNDLLFHAHTRRGPHDLRAAGYDDRLPAGPPAVPPPAGRAISLHRPDRAAAPPDAPPTHVADGAAPSGRGAAPAGRSDEPLTGRQLGELLFLAARVRRAPTGGVSRPPTSWSCTSRWTAVPACRGGSTTTPAPSTRSSW